jgi:hypothetical protein
MEKILFKEIKVSNAMMNDLVNYGFRNFPNEKLEIPLDITENQKILDIIVNGIPFVKFYADNSENFIEFYFRSINSVESLKFSDLELKTNYFTFFNNKYLFDK